MGLDQTVEEVLNGLEPHEREHFLSTKSYEPGTRKAEVTYAGMQIAPPGSLAYRFEVRGKDRSSAGLDIGNLCREFFDGRKPGFVPNGSVLQALKG